MEIREERLIYPQFQLHRSSNRYSIFKRVFQITLLTRVAELFSQGSDRFIPAPDNERPKPSELRRAGECAQTYWGFIDGMLAPKPALAAPVEPMPAETAPKLTEIARAMSWLDQVLNAGPVAQKEVERLAVDAENQRTDIEASQTTVEGQKREKRPKTLELAIAEDAAGGCEGSVGGRWITVSAFSPRRFSWPRPARAAAP